MNVVYLAEYQLRLLMGKPDDAPGLRWVCGCMAALIQPQKYVVLPCDKHLSYLAVVHEDEEYIYDGMPAVPWHGAQRRRAT